MRQRSDDLDPAEQRILDDVAEWGVHVVTVPEGKAAGYSFTIGLWESFGQPEVVVFGLPPQVATELLNLIADEADEGTKFTAGSRHEGLLHDYAVRFVEVPKAQQAEFLARAQWAYEGEDFPAVQLVWPDKQGRWPWDPEARDGFRSGQPVLGPAPG